MTEHVDDCDKDLEGSHAASHLKLEHPLEWQESRQKQESAWKYFGVEILSTHRTAFRRQHHEAVSISRETGTVLNNLEEYSRCLIPTLEVKGARKETQESRQSKEQRARNREKEVELAWENQDETQGKRLSKQHQEGTHTKKHRQTYPDRPEPKNPEVEKQAKQKRKRPNEVEGDGTGTRETGSTHKTSPKRITKAARNQEPEAKTGQESEAPHKTQPERRKNTRKVTPAEPKQIKLKPKPILALKRTRKADPASHTVDIRSFFSNKRESGPDVGLDVNINLNCSNSKKDYDTRGDDKLTNLSKQKTTDSNVLDQSKSNL